MIRVNDCHFGVQELKVSLLQRIRLKLWGVAYVFHARKEGWSGELPFYIVKCGKHGYFLDYSHGYAEYFLCPSCLKEEVKKYD